MKTIKLLAILIPLFLLSFYGCIVDEHEVNYWIDSFNFEEGETYNISDPMWLRSGDFTIPKNCTVRFIDSSYLSMYMGSHLIIEEGAVIELRDSLWLSFGDDCRLTVNGTAENLVTFRNVDSTSEFGWGGIYLTEDSDSSGHVIRHAVIDGAIKGIEVNLKNNLILEGTVIKNCKGYGFVVQRNTVEHNGNILKHESSVLINDNQFINNSLYDILIGVEYLTIVDTSNQLSSAYIRGNYGTSPSYVEENSLCLPKNATYTVDGYLACNGVLLILEGTTFKFPEGNKLPHLYSLIDILKYGTIKAYGTPANPIRFRPSENAYFNGIEISSPASDTQENVIDNAIIDSALAGVTLYDGAKLTLKNSIITNFSYSAIYMYKTALYIGENNTGFDSTDIIIKD